MRPLVGLCIALTVLASTAVVSAEVSPSKVKFEDGAVAIALTSDAGNAAEGRKAFSNRKQGNCLACHVNADMPEQSFQGEVGPPLDGVADRWSEAELRGIVTNSKMTFEDTIMPAFYMDSGFTRPLEKFEGKTILSAQQVEDLVAYLLTLKE